MRLLSGNRALETTLPVILSQYEPAYAAISLIAYPSIFSDITSSLVSTRTRFTIR
jgi:hypothetical protein